MPGMEEILSKIGVRNDDKRQLLLLGAYASGFLCFPLTICSFVVAGTANAGFNAVFTALLNIVFSGEAFYIVSNSKTPLAIGFLMGTSIMITLINFMAAIFWGQLSKCQWLNIPIAQYSCSHPAAYTAVCVFAIFLFLVHGAFTVALFMWKGELINETYAYGEVPNAHPVYSMRQPSASADL